ncbi:MAG: hypothetical protein P8188_11455 [Gemmatimonadota bacterium]
MPVFSGERATQMAGRLHRTAVRRGVSDPGLVTEAFRWAMQPRQARLDDDHDPRFLHPGRTALILMDDAGITDPVTLAAAVFAETEAPELAWSPETVPGASDPRLDEALTLARAIPLPKDDEGLTEALVTARDPIAVVALAEYLDQLRHLRAWASPETIRARGETAARVLVPVAGRVDPALERRLGWWVRRVEGLDAGGT